MADALEPAASLVPMLQQVVMADPGAIIAIDAGASEPRQVTRGELWQRVLALRSELVERGVLPGSCVGVWLPNWSDAFVWQFAAATLGAHVIGINTRYNVDEVAHLLDRAQPIVIAIAHNFVKLDLDARLRQAVLISTATRPSIAVVCGPHGAEPSARDLERYDVGGGAWIPCRTAVTSSAATPALHVAPDALAIAFTTSGSTGKPKLAAHSSGAVAAHAYAAARAGGWKAGDVTLCALPLSGVFAFIPAMATIATGGTCLLEPSFTPDTIVPNIGRFGVTHVVGADDIVGRLLDAWKAQPCELSRWRRLLLADFNGKSTEIAAFAEEQFGLKASGVYGSSELFALTSLWPETVAAPKRWLGGGKPVSPRIQVRCADPDTNEVVAPGISGELQFRGYNVVDAYLGAPELHPQQFTADGWFRSGDLGVMHEDGSFDYVCRAGDALRIKGFLVEPAEIEARIVAHPTVDIVKVVGLKLPNGETEAVAFVLLKRDSNATGEELRTWCAQGLARHKVPRSVHVIDEMPTTSGVNGIKIKTAELRLWAQQREQASDQAQRSAQGGV